MRVVFADAGYWIALLDPHDLQNAKARAVAHTLGSTQIVTTYLVLAEALNHFAGGGEHIRRQASTFVEGLMNDRQIEVEPVTSERFGRAVAPYASRLDKGWGLTDCTSFLIMQERSITEALAHDQHFVQAGFTALLRT